MPPGAEPLYCVAMPDSAISREFLRAYDEYSDAIFRHCYFRLSDRERALEISQETFTRAWDYLSQGKEIRSMKPFLYRVASNLIVEEYRKHKSVSLDAILDDELQGEGSVAELRDDESTGRMIDLLDGRRAMDALKKLPEQYREVLVLRFVDGLSPKEIALFLEERENTVSVRIHRGLARLKEIIEA